MIIKEYFFQGRPRHGDCFWPGGCQGWTERGQVPAVLDDHYLHHHHHHLHRHSLSHFPELHTNWLEQSVRCLWLILFILDLP